ncbi:MAG: hypothetical protein AB7G06_02370 [Bdellovibrionales bacterium]
MIIQPNLLSKEEIEKERTASELLLYVESVNNLFLNEESYNKRSRVHETPFSKQFHDEVIPLLKLAVYLNTAIPNSFTVKNYLNQQSEYDAIITWGDAFKQPVQITASFSEQEKNVMTALNNFGHASPFGSYDKNGNVISEPIAKSSEEILEQAVELSKDRLAKKLSKVYSSPIWVLFNLETHVKLHEKELLKLKMALCDILNACKNKNVTRVFVAGPTFNDFTPNDIVFDSHLSCDIKLA